MITMSRKQSSDSVSTDADIDADNITDNGGDYNTDN